MIKMIGAVDLPPETSRRIMLDVVSWPEWMPSIRSTRVLERSEKRILAEVVRLEGRRRYRTKLELLPSRGGYFERQISGPVRRWELNWDFRRAPEGGGSVVSCDFDVNLGWFGVLLPKRSLHRQVERTFDRILRGIVDHASSTPPSAAAKDSRAQTPAVKVSRIRIFSCQDELEIWLDDRRFIGHRAD